MLRRRLVWGVLVVLAAVLLLSLDGGHPKSPPGIAPVLGADFEEADWEEPETKWTPIFGLENTNIFLGAAQVAGPKEQVDKVRAVAQIQLSFKNLARIRAYVPVSKISTKTCAVFRGYFVQLQYK